MSAEIASGQASPAPYSQAEPSTAGDFGYHTRPFSPAPTFTGKFLPMQALLEFAPLAAFLVAYYAAGLYTATAVLMAAMAILLVVDYARGRRIPPMHALSALLVF